MTVVEWGEGIAEALSDDRLRVHLARGHGGDDTEETPEQDLRTALVTPVGARWFGARVRSSLLAGRGGLLSRPGDSVSRVRP